MTAKQAAQYAAQTSFLLVVEANEAVAQTMPAFFRQIQTLRVLMVEAKAADVAATVNTSGITQDKLATKTELFTNMNALTALVSAYAHEINDAVLSKRVNGFSSVFNNTRQHELGAVCHDILNKVRPHLAGLADYAVTEPMLQDCETLIDMYEGKVPTTRAHTKARKVNTQDRDGLFDKMSNLMNNRILKLAVAFQKTDLVFYNKMLAAAGIDSTAVAYTQIKLVFQKSPNSKRLPHGMMAMTPEHPVPQQANDKGELTLRFAKGGIKNIEIPAEDGAPIFQQDILAVKGKTVKVVVPI